jgi:hypothetical protein
VISAFDRPHRLVGSGIWELPVGKGRRYGNDMPGFLNFIAGGWQLSGAYQMQSGQPLGFGNRIYNGASLDDINLPNDVRSVDRWLNVDAGFVRSAAQQLGNNYRTFPLRFSGIRGPGQLRWDFSALKRFKITERFVAEFRGDTFNAFNNVNLGNPNTDPTSGNFGVISSQDPPRSWQFALKITF